jgi:hypothetical protein
MNCPPPRRSCSLKDLQVARESQPAALVKSPSLANLAQHTSSSSSTSPSIASSSSTSAAGRYQLWPASRSPVGVQKSALSDRLAALSVGRSSTSLSDTAVLPESVPFWQRSSSLARRRKVSVPELGQTMTTVQEMAVDSRMYPLPIINQFHLSHCCSYYPRETSSTPNITRELWSREVLQCSRYKLENWSFWRCHDVLRYWSLTGSGTA